MPLKFLLDENISSAIVDQVRAHNPEIWIDSVQNWRNKTFRGRPDRSLLFATREDELTLVTYDLRTIPHVLSELAFRGEEHGGVIFIDDKTIRSNDLGGLTRALLNHWTQFGGQDWRNRVGFLEKTAGS